MIAHLQHTPEKFRDGAAMSSRTQRFGLIPAPCTGPVSVELAVQQQRRLTVAHPDTETASGFTEKLIALRQGQLCRWRATTGTPGTASNTDGRTGFMLTLGR